MFGVSLLEVKCGCGAWKIGLLVAMGRYVRARLSPECFCGSIACTLDALRLCAVVCGFMVRYKSVYTPAVALGCGRRVYCEHVVRTFTSPMYSREPSFCHTSAYRRRVSLRSPFVRCACAARGRGMCCVCSNWRKMVAYIVVLYIQDYPIPTTFRRYIFVPSRPARLTYRAPNSKQGSRCASSVVVDAYDLLYLGGTRIQRSLFRGFWLVSCDPFWGAL
jgi:hypothetical protein